MFDALSFFLGGLFFSGLVMWISVLGIDSKRIQEKIKNARDNAFPKKAVIVKKQDKIDELIG